MVNGIRTKSRRTQLPWPQLAGKIILKIKAESLKGNVVQSGTPVRYFCPWFEVYEVSPKMSIQKGKNLIPPRKILEKHGSGGYLLFKFYVLPRFLAAFWTVVAKKVYFST